MKILAVDTATPSCSVAVMENGRLAAELTLDRPQTHSKHLMAMIRKVLDLCGLRPEGIEGLAVTHGPGSFTGLRIGMATVKGLAAALDRPVVTVSTLHALASQASFFPHIICPLIDARRNELYCSRYHRVNNELQAVSDELVLPVEKALGGLHEPALFIGNGAVAYRRQIVEILGDKAVLAAQNANLIRAGSVAAIARNKLDRREHEDLGSLAPRYLRKSDAEINFSEK